MAISLASSSCRPSPQRASAFLRCFARGLWPLMCAGALAISKAVCNLRSGIRKAKFADLAAEARDREAQPAVTVLPARLRPGLNLTRRPEALRLYRHGESIARVL